MTWFYRKEASGFDTNVCFSATKAKINIISLNILPMKYVYGDQSVVRCQRILANTFDTISLIVIFYLLMNWVGINRPESAAEKKEASGRKLKLQLQAALSFYCMCN